MTSRQQTSVRQGLWLLVLGATFISFAPIFVKWVGEERLGPTAMAFWRTLFGAVTLSLICLVRGKTLNISGPLMKFAVIAGLVFSADLFVWHRSVLYCGAGMSTILGNTQVFATALISFFLFKDRLTVRYFVAAISAMFGVVLLVGVLSEDVAFTDRYVQGVIFGLATGLAYASYLVTIKLATQKHEIPDVVVFMAWVSAASAVGLGLAGLVEGVPMVPPDLPSWLYLIGLGIVAQAIGWWVITSGLKRVVASKAGLILLLQPTLAMVWGVLFFAEQFTWEQMIGAIMTLAAIYFGGLRNGNKSQ